MYVCARARVYAHAVVLGHPLLRNLHRMDQVQNRAKQATHSHTRAHTVSTARWRYHLFAEVASVVTAEGGGKGRRRRRKERKGRVKKKKKKFSLKATELSKVWNWYQRLEKQRRLQFSLDESDENFFAVTAPWAGGTRRGKERKRAGKFVKVDHTFLGGHGWKRAVRQ